MKTCRNMIKSFAIIIATITINISCKKQQDDFLNVKANNYDVTPKTLADFQALLDNDAIMNNSYSELGLASSDNYYVIDDNYPSLTSPEKQLYTWTSDIWQSQESAEWNYIYAIVEYSNIVLDGIANVSPDNSIKSSYNNIKGSAYFFRALAFYNLAAAFCKPYTATSAKTDLGIPLRLTSDVNAKSVRSSVQQTYDRIISDLKTAIDLLPLTPLRVTRPSSRAAQALLAKVYLSMEQYSDALQYADAVLKAKSDLLDYNDNSLVTPTATRPFPRNPDNNSEILFYANGWGYATVWPLASISHTDTTLYDSYDINDIRKVAFFYNNSDGTHRFKGTYDAYSKNNFAGLATDELYLIRAECYARAGNTSSSTSDLNALLSKRYTTGTFTALSTNNADTALHWVLVERRKELPFTGTCRWEDLRRLNKDPRFAITIKRIIAGITYTLEPNSPKYILPIPDKEIQLSGIQQNQR